MAELDHVEWHRRERLRDPILIAAFEGWNDAGDAATMAARHLRDVWDLDLVAELDPEEFYSFTDTRPQVAFDDGGLRHIEWPANRFWAGEIPGKDREHGAGRDQSCGRVASRPTAPGGRRVVDERRNVVAGGKRGCPRRALESGGLRTAHAQADAYEPA